MDTSSDFYYTHKLYYIFIYIYKLDYIYLLIFFLATLHCLFPDAKDQTRVHGS